MANIPIYIPTYINSVDYTPAKVQPRLLFYNGMLDCESYYIESASVLGGIAREQTKFPYFDNYNVVTGSFPTVDSKSLLFYNEESVYGQTPTDTLYSDYWEKYVELLYNPRTKLLNASAIIPLANYFKISQNDIIEFRGNYYHLRAINDYNLSNGECSIQLLGPILPDALPFVINCDYSSLIVICNEPTTTTSTTSTTTTSTTSTTSTSTTTTTTLGPLFIEYIIVAGGGSGGGRSDGSNLVWPGGGGGGGVITGSMITNTPLTIGVGAQGQNIIYQNNPNLNPKNVLGNPLPCWAGFFSGSHGSKGFPSYISASGIYEIAQGGGQGGTWNDPNNANYPIPFYAGVSTLGGYHSAGGNGGGAALVSGGLSTYNNISGGLSTGGGFNGAWSTGSAGNLSTLGTNNSGGGAGAGANGNGGNGGNGYQWLNGTYYAGGGSGFVKFNGSTYPQYQNGTPGLGGGGGFNTDGSTGGGGGAATSTFYPANGGAGIVIIRYAGTTQKATGGTISTSGGYTYHTFQSTWSGGIYIVDAVSGSNGITGGYYGYDRVNYNETGQWRSAYTASFIPFN
jgi:hypothetical protein